MKTVILTSLITLISLVSACAWSAPLKTTHCSRTERSQIKTALNWLLDNLPNIDRRLLKNELSDWPGRSRKRFVTRIKKRELTIVCQKKQSRCSGDKVPYWIEADGRRLPVLHSHQIQLCTRELRGASDYALVIAHELGHLVWVNAHRKVCADTCLKLRLSRSLEVAVKNEQQGRHYDPTSCLVACGEQPLQAIEGAAGGIQAPPIPPANPTPSTPPVP